MKKHYHILDSAKQKRVSPDERPRLLSQNAQLMPPLVERIEQCRGAVDEVINVTGLARDRATVETGHNLALEISSEGKAGLGALSHSESRPLPAATCCVNCVYAGVGAFSLGRGKKSGLV